MGTAPMKICPELLAVVAVRCPSALPGVCPAQGRAATEAAAVCSYRSSCSTLSHQNPVA